MYIFVNETTNLLRLDFVNFVVVSYIFIIATLSSLCWYFVLDMSMWILISKAVVNTKKNLEAWATCDSDAIQSDIAAVAAIAVINVIIAAKTNLLMLVLVSLLLLILVLFL